MVVWITGLSGSGKTTVAGDLVSRIRDAAIPAVHLDGDAVREAIADESTGYDLLGRKRNALRICRLAALCDEQRLEVVVSTMSLFHEIHRWNREHFASYLEVYIEADVHTLAARNAKGVYSGTFPVVGLDMSVEAPESPHLILRNDFTLACRAEALRSLWLAWAARRAYSPTRTPAPSASP